MDDLLVITKTQDDAFVQRDRVGKLLSRLGLFWNEKKGHWEPTQLVEPLGLEARYIRSKANEGADRLSRDKGLDNWRINGRWFKYAEENWGEHSVDRFASEISAQLPSNGGVTVLAEPILVPGAGGAGDRGGHNNKEYDEMRPGDKIEILWPEDLEWYPGIVGATGNDGRTTIQFDDGDVENIVLKEEGYRVPPSVTTEAQHQQWLPPTAATVQLYVASLLEAGTVKGTSLQPYLSAINCFHKDFSLPGPAKGRAVTRAVKGMTAMQTAAAEQ
ncbi:hypothetical protein CYMTET_20950 [Cymbomonas tetramitiformis]|uniref:Uncharacterized protein n=1 Tax=Cymbomonas tetramitiformis TaxID=36881 RepID=A0AAE0L3C6_9CHLO|nr:hypothetical protein CYMTET_20950 [Cymbomonas tetramitiformis]